ncbi:MAG TPA: RIP metalloprotease RseP [Clostridiales bacterium]|nr:RIP metalloprotease RseP [Clostridiales bacterium]
MGLTAIYAILIFCLLIFVHELGHFMVAKAVDIRVNEFSLGMGPPLLKFHKGETDYSLRLLPIGGYVKMEGEDEDSADPRAFNSKPVWQKAIVVVAGSVMNLLTTVIIITLIALILGLPIAAIGELQAGGPAEQAGLQASDKIIAIDGQAVQSWEDVIKTISGSQGETVAVDIERDGSSMKIESEVAEDESGRRYIGILAGREHSPLRALITGFVTTWDWTKQMIWYLGQLLTGRGSVEDLVGPVGIVSLINDQAKLGFLYIANLAALISLNLGIINLLPFPALDGGRLLFLLIRQFTGKAISDATEGKIHFVGIMLLFGLMIYLVFQDVGRFILN